MAKNMKRGISLFLALVFVLTLLPAAALATDKPAKFEVVVSSKVDENTTTEVKGTVDADYQATLFIPDAVVNASNVTMKVTMTDVASLGIKGTHTYERTLNTGVNYSKNIFEALDIAAGMANLENEAIKNFGQTTVNATINAASGESKSVVYTIKGEFEEGVGETINATAPTADARAAWQLMTEGNFTSGTKTEDDSYFVIANGSWLQIGNEKLVFEKDGDLILDNLNDASVIQNIKDMVTITDTKSNALRFHLAAGTTLAMSQSSAKLNNDLDVTVTGLGVVPNVLSDLRTAVNNNDTGVQDMLIALMISLEKAVDLVNNKSINVEMTFSEPVTPKFQVVVSSKLEDGSTTSVVGSVFNDYSAELVLPNADVNASNVTVKVSMADVASLGIAGVREYSMTLNTGVNKAGNLPGTLAGLAAGWGTDKEGLDALYGFEGATINANIISNGEKATVVYTLNGSEFDLETSDEKIITADVNEADARAAWQLMIEGNIVAGTKADDSYILIANGSELQIGNEKLVFEDSYEGDLKVDNIKSDVAGNVQNIKNAVTVIPTEESALAFTLKAGTELAVSSSYAKLAKDVKVNVTGIENIPNNILSGLRDAVNNGEMNPQDVILKLLNLMEQAVALVDGANITVDIEFIYPWTVTFMDGTEVVDEQIVNGGDAAVEPEVELTKTGYIFSGWALTEDGDAYDINTAVTEDITLHAIWTPIEYTLILNGERVTLNYEEVYELPELSKDGWSFQGWALTEDGEMVYAPGAEVQGLATNNGAEVVLYPVWGDHTHNFQFVEGSWNWTDDLSRATAEFICDQCDEYTEETPFVQVAAITSRVMSMPTCSVEGERRYTATALFVTDTKSAAIPTIPHTTVDMTLAATCTSAGREGGLVCTVCNTVVEEPVIVAPLGHHWDEGVVTIPAGYGTEGVRTYTCLNDSTHTYTEAIPALVSPGGSTGGTTITDNDVPLAGVLPFNDVSENDYFYEAVKYVYDNELMSGTSDTTFSPYTDTTRGMIVTILYRLEGEPAVTGTSKFADVAAGDYYHNAVVWGTANGIVAGYDETTYGPADIITREQFAAILFRYAQYKNYDVKVSDGAALEFTDADKVSDYAKSALLWAVEKELIRGMGDGTVSPNTGATRAQAAIILKGFSENIVK